MPNVKVCPDRKFDLCQMDSAGLVKIKLSPEQARNRFVELFVLTEGYVLIDPWDNKVREHVNPMTPIEVKVIQIGDKKALRDGFVLASLVKMINYKKQAMQNAGGPTVDLMEGALSIVARSCGTTPRELDQMIRARQRRASAAEKGQYALYQGQLSTARGHFLASREAAQRERLAEAENDFFLGQTQFRLGEYSEAGESFARAQALGMKDDPRLLDYVGWLEARKGNATGALEILEKSLAIKERSLPANDPDLLASRVQLVRTYFLVDNSDKPQVLLDKIWDTCEAALAKDFGAAAPALFDLMDFYTELDDDVNLDYDFALEIRWLKALLKTTAHKQIEAKHVESVRAGAFLLQIYASRDWNDLYDEERKEVEESALQLLRLVRGRTVGNSTDNRRSRSTQRQRVPQSSDANNVAWTIPTLLRLSQYLSNENTKRQLFDEGVRLAKGIAREDPDNALHGLLYAASIAGDDDQATYDGLVKIIFEIAETTRVLENPASAEAVIKFAINYHGSQGEAGIKLLFERVKSFSNRIWKNEHALDAVTLMFLAQALEDSSVPNRQDLLAWPINRVVTNLDEMLKTPSGMNLVGLAAVAALCVELKRHDDAELLFTKVRDILENSWGARNPIARHCLTAIAETQLARGLLAEADATYQQALDNVKRRLGPDHPKVAELINGRIEVLERMKRLDEVTVLRRQALAIEEKHEEAERGRWLQKINKELRELEEKEDKLGPTHPSLIPLLSSLAEAYQNRDDYEEAATFYEQLLTAYEADKSADIADVVFSIKDFAKVLVKLESYDEAEANYRKAVALLEHRKDSTWLMIMILEDHAKLLKSRGKESEAAKILLRLTELKKE
ncbi:MAG TPA: tetratricopeptide repeat protein [Pyrinomonadaceae bacterium]|nr:tetratricopeptide repeat protein [Pyrinomonadaceae bacterium]